MSIVGNILVAIGITIVQVVLVQNSHAAVTVRVEAGQQLVSTGLYGLVRHPMYTCNAFLLVGVPLALGSYWGLIFIIPSVLVFAFRIHDEEALLQEELAGYREYMQKVRYRLVPGVW
jgi:protein-S-isoprenylcysteine O-methyltransferase Ste14